MLQFELLDETFDLNQSNTYHLSIQADLDGFLFALLDPDGLKYLGLKQYSFKDIKTDEQLYDKIKQVIAEDPLLQHPYASVACMHADARSTLLPAALFDRNQLKSYYEFNHPLKDLDELHYNYLKYIDAYIIFPVYHELVNLYLSSWVNTSFYHPVTALVEEVMAPGMDPAAAVSVHFSGNHFDILVSEGQKLRFHNNFSFRSDEDMLYFILFVFDKLGLDQENTPLFLSGNIDKFSDRPSVLKQYFKVLRFRNIPSEFRYPPAFEKIQDHIYLNLFKVFHCA